MVGRQEDAAHKTKLRVWSGVDGAAVSGVGIEFSVEVCRLVAIVNRRGSGVGVGAVVIAHFRGVCSTGLKVAAEAVVLGEVPLGVKCASWKSQPPPHLPRTKQVPQRQEEIRREFRDTNTTAPLVLVRSLLPRQRHQHTLMGEGPQADL